MDKKKINTFAINARRELINSIKLELVKLGIDENGIADKLESSTKEIEFYGNPSYQITGKDISRREALVNHLKNRHGEDSWNTTLETFIEEVAYTWFNRIIAIRFMEVNDYLPSRTRVLSSETNQNEPDILINALDIEDELGGFSQDERALIIKARNLEQPEDLDKAYRMLFLKQANALNENLPNLFEKTAFFMDLLFTPSYHSGVINDLIVEIDENDFDVTKDGQVEIIGWLYQYYNQEPKDISFKKKKYTKADIAPVTQLFTPDWVVRYMVENSLGALWIDILQAKGDARSKTDIAKSYNWQYFMPQAEQTADVERLIVKADKELLAMQIEDITIIDPAMGSGHILVYAFEVLMQIYKSEAYSERNAAEAILTHNLYGVDIDPRAFQLTYFALMMKARNYNRNALKKNLHPNVYYVPATEIKLVDVEPLFDGVKLIDAEQTKRQLSLILNQVQIGDELGSIIHFDEPLNFVELEKLVDNEKFMGELTFDMIDAAHVQIELKNIVGVMKVLASQFTIGITNPPYMGGGNMPVNLKKFVAKHYPASKSDLFAIFMERLPQLVQENGYYAMITQHQWMFLSSYEKLRASLKKHILINMVHLGTRAFEEIGGEVVQTTTFVSRKVNVPEYVGTYERLVDYPSQSKKQEAYLQDVLNPTNKEVYRTNQTNFDKIPGSPIAYWASENILSDFENGTRMDQLVDPRQGLATADNNRFLRQWFEVKHQNIKFNAKDIPDSVASGLKWFPYNKGGSYRKWYGNNDYVVNWENDGFEIRNFKDAKGKLRSVTRNPSYYFREAITWSDVNSGHFSLRYRKAGSIHDVKGMSAFSIKNKGNLFLILNILNTKIGDYIFNMLNPTISLQIGNFQSFPVLNSKINDKTALNNISISKTDWDSFETSWDFTTHPFMQHIDEHNRKWTLKEAFKIWSDEANNRFNQLKANEEELNRIFIDLYGLQDELTPEVEDNAVSVSRADEVRDVKSFLSYFVGCVLGRYSIDTPGLAYAGGDWDDSKYQSFVPNKDNMLVLTDDDYYKDNRDIINRLREFLAITFGAENVEENMHYIADVIGKKADSDEDIIRKYFIDNYYKDHLKIYSKRPIYWEFSAGKNAGFRALMYVHRYDEDTMAMVRNAFVLPLQEAYQRMITTLVNLAESEPVSKVKREYTKKIAKLEKQIEEVKQYDSVIQHIANEHIGIDLDDGVVVNYAKIQGEQKLLTKI